MENYHGGSGQSGLASQLQQTPPSNARERTLYERVQQLEQAQAAAFEEVAKRISMLDSQVNYLEHKLGVSYAESYNPKATPSY